MQNNKAADMITELTNKRVSNMMLKVVGGMVCDPLVLTMERYYEALNQLPTEILLKTGNLDEIKHSRWLTRDKFLHQSQLPFAASNGIGPDQLRNLLDLQDAVIANLLIKKLELDESRPLENNFKIYSLLQMILTESPKLLDFIFMGTSRIPLDTLKLLIQNCPALFHCIILLKDFTTLQNYWEIGSSRLYYWNFIIHLALKYPIQATLDLVKEVAHQIQQNIEDCTETEGEGESVKNNINWIIESIDKTFPRQVPLTIGIINHFKIK